MLSKNYAKLIPNLAKKKYRQKYNLFVVEGSKSVVELLKSQWNVKILFTTVEETWNFTGDTRVITSYEMQQISHLKTPSEVLALVELPTEQPFVKEDALTLVLAQINDPGNLGTILRTADWFGLSQIICEKGSVDLFNPKTIQASMGSFLRVRTYYLERDAIPLSQGACVGTYMDGGSIYAEKLPAKPFLVLGNEANGIPPEWEKKIGKRLSIPRRQGSQVESLNVATAAAICLSEFARQEKV